MEIRNDLRDLREKFSRLRQDPPSFNLAVAVVLLAVGLAGVTMPLSGTLESRRETLAQSRERASVAERLDKHLQVWQLVAPRVVAKADAVDWGDYLLLQMRSAGLRLLSQEPPEVAEIGSFRKLTLSVRAGGSYAAIVDFVDRLERGERLMRVDRLQISMGQTELELDIEVVGLAGSVPESWATQVEAR